MLFFKPFYIHLGQGLNIGVNDVKTLSSKVHEILKSWAFQDIHSACVRLNEWAAEITNVHEKLKELKEFVALDRKSWSIKSVL